MNSNLVKTIHKFIDVWIEALHPNLEFTDFYEDVIDVIDVDEGDVVFTIRHKERELGIPNSLWWDVTFSFSLDSNAMGFISFLDDVFITWFIKKFPELDITSDFNVFIT